MNRKIVFLAAILIIGAAGAAGAQSEDFGIGMNWGTNTGIAIDFGHFFTNIGLDLRENSRSGDLRADIDIGWDFTVLDFSLKHGHFPISIGPMVPFQIGQAGDEFYLGSGVLLQAKVEYRSYDKPVGLYVRGAAGIGLNLLKPDLMDTLSLPVWKAGAGIVVYPFASRAHRSAAESANEPE